MSKFNNSIVPNKVRIGWHFSSNKYAYRDAYSAHKSMAYSQFQNKGYLLVIICLVSDVCFPNSAFLLQKRLVIYLNDVCLDLKHHISVLLLIKHYHFV